MYNQEVSDRRLLDLYRSGNQPALEALILRYKDKVYTTIYFLVKNRVLTEDIFQNTFIKVINQLREGKYNEEGKFGAWAAMIARNLCIDHFRKVKKKLPIVNNDGKEDIFSFIKSNTENVEEGIIRNETCEKVKILLETLPAEQKEVVLLRHYAGLSFKEIAIRLDISINTALGRMRYALNKMRNIIKEKEIIIE